MKQNIKIINDVIFDLTKKLELSWNELKYILNRTILIEEKSHFTLGGPPYSGGYYGALSIKDF